MGGQQTADSFGIRRGIDHDRRSACVHRKHPAISGGEPEFAGVEDERHDDLRLQLPAWGTRR